MNDILMVEDDVLVRVGLSRVLTEAGYRTRGAGSLAQALEQVASAEPELVVLDIGLPDGDGLACAARLREAGFEGPLVFLTADDEAATVSRAIGLRAAAYLVKPVSGAQLIPAVQTALALAQSSRLREQQLLDALRDSREVSAAVGVLAERHAWSIEGAFEALRASARREGRRITEAARHLLRERRGGP